ncbi:MAG: hypothetical protein H0V12_11475 [Chloroflexi bacterium]|nr:hypothetical protein [Chloroflexota bacterium]
MTSIAVVAGSAAAARPQDLLAAMTGRGVDVVELWRDDAAAISAQAWGWQAAPDTMVARRGPVAVAVDATLYYRDDLVRRLHAAGVHTGSHGAAALVLAAYEAWGEGFVHALEGDWALALWDGARHRLICARDSAGRRPLYYAVVDGSAVVASTVRGVLAHPGCPDELDLPSIAAAAAGVFDAEEATGYRFVHALAAGCMLVRDGLANPRISRHWHPPPHEEVSRLPEAEAAEQLRALLSRATEERIAQNGDPTSVWMSGGWDSTAVYGAAADVLRRSGRPLPRPVSISYPVGDPGREDEFITDVASFWDTRVHWLDIGDIPMLTDLDAFAARRDSPFGHAYAEWLRALARGSRAEGTTVALDGWGGDQLFQISDIYLADLLRAGRLRELARELRVRRRAGWSNGAMRQWAVEPVVPPRWLSRLDQARGRSPRLGYLDEKQPRWVAPDLLRLRPIPAAGERHHRRAGESRVAAEARWYLTHPYFPRVFTALSGMALEEGVELRSPLIDQRIITFALARPRTDRARALETKRLLRQAMKGLLPDSVLAARKERTGVTGGYFVRSMRRSFGALLERALDGSALVGYGVVDEQAIRSAWQGWLRNEDGDTGVRLLHTVQAELWVRARMGSSAGSADSGGRQLLSGSRSD